MNEVHGLRDAMSAQANMVPIPERFTFTENPEGTPSLLLTDTETGRTSPVALGDYRSVRKVLLELFGDQELIDDFHRVDELRRLRSIIYSHHPASADPYRPWPAADVDAILADFDAGNLTAAATAIRAKAETLAEPGEPDFYERELALNLATALDAVANAKPVTP